ncbi:MAG: minichromosome maintenance protein MCM [Candidatus Bathyarchaeia archaeon]
MAVETSLDVKEKLQEFFRGNKYRTLIKQMAVEGRRSLEVDFLDLSIFDSSIAQKLQKNFDTYQEEAREALLAQLRVEAPEYAETVKKTRIYVRFKNLLEPTSLRKICSDQIDRLVSFDGIVIRATPVRPLLVEAAFKCRCGETIFKHQEGPFVRPPSRCENPSCRRERGFELIVEKSMFMDCQEFRVQERPEDLPPGQLPRFIEVTALDDLVDTARPGDRVKVTGVVRAKPEFIPGKGRLRTFTVSIDANHIETVSTETGEVEISPEDERKIKEIARREFLYKDLVDSIAPTIYGYEDIKEAIVYLLFGGVPKTTPEGVSIRGDIHVLLVGDPGTAKSQLLRYVARLSPRGLFTTGRGTTAAGLTAAVLREKSGGMALEAGALVLADKGLASVDEIDKMRDEDRVAMHEMMEQQTVSVAKAGIVATLNARASILAAANPKFGRYEDRLTVSENINIPIVILSRFDLIFIQKDKPARDFDEALSEHILKVHRSAGSAAAPPIPADLLRKYISYAKTRVHPKLSEEAAKRLRSFYLKMRESSGSDLEESPIAITARQLEALVRLAEARARAALRDTVTAMDAEAAIKIMEKSLRDVGAVREAGLVDIDVVMTGVPKTVKEGLTTTLKLIGEIEKEAGEVDLEVLYQRLEAEYKISRSNAEGYVRRLKSDGTIYTPRDGYVKRARA